MRVRRSIVVTLDVLIAVFILGWWSLVVERADDRERVVKSIVDKKTGWVVELAITMDGMAGSHYGAVYLFRPRNNFLDRYRFYLPVILLGRPKLTSLDLFLDGECYAVAADYDRVITFKEKWSPYFSFDQLCFDLWPVQMPEEEQ